MNHPPIDYDPELMLYEDPPSLRIEDWETFCDKMRAEAARFPNSQNVRLTLQSSERMLRELREEWTESDAKAA
ncbi:hypothetical protein [uncultured Thiocystis sp.]|jgi:hypothetical protein|uniref:hypothetical protein n=1 Tax=uncultured Thiocystis sp. TaxID=1202134 RepID=UPI0025F5D81A|nr:hypothetical protein [uncultured Thiocystis sp.]